MRWKQQFGFIPLAFLSSPLLAQQLSFVELPAHPASVPIGLSAAFPTSQPLMTELEGNSIVGAFQPNIEFPIPTPNSGPMGITALGSEEYWFTESRANKIGRILFIAGTPNRGTFFPEITIPTESSTPHGIVRDGSAAWFTEFTGNKIGRAAITDVVNNVVSVTAEFPIPTPAAGPAGIAVDSRIISGAPVWFTESLANKIGRFDPSTGTMAEYAIPTANSGPLEIVQSGDAFWFTESNVGKVGRIRPDGQITEYVVNSRTSIPSGIAADGVGGVWFTERGSGLVGRIKVDGQLQEFSLPTAGSGPVAITTYTPTSIAFSTRGSPSLLVAESAGSNVAIATADSLVLVGAGYSDGWDTLVEASNPESFPIPGTLSLGPVLSQCVIHVGCPGPPNFPLAPHGTARRLFSDLSGTSGFFTFFFISDSFSTAPLDLPSVKARIFNRSVPAQSVDLPVIRLSTLQRLNPKVLSFPSVTRKSGGARSNLIISAVLGPGVYPMTCMVELFSQAGELLASASFDITNGSLGPTLFIQDIVGTLGLADLEQGSIRVTRTTSPGLLWAVLMTVAEDGSLTYSLGQNP